MELYQAAMKYVGVPWKHRGRTANGMDCLGLLVLSIQDCGGTVEDRRDYGREAWTFGLLEELQKRFKQKDINDIGVNDIVMARLYRTGHPVHTGIVAPYPNGLGVIHTYGDVMEVVYTRLSERYRSLITGVFECRPA